MENSSASTTLQDSPIVFPPDAFRWYTFAPFFLGLLVVFFVVFFGGAIYWVLSNQISGTQVASRLMGMPAVVIQGIAEIVAIAYILLLLPSVARRSLRGIGLRKLTGADARVIIAGAIVMFAVVAPLATLFETLLHFKTPEEAIAAFTGTTGWARVVFVFFAAVLAPVFEEAVFRLVLFNAMRHWWGFWPGAIVSSMLFGLAHAQPPFTGGMFASITFPLAVGGMVLCFVYAKTNNAWANLITHGVFNGLTFVVLIFFPQLAK